MEEVLIFATILAPILTALVQLVKKTVKLPTNIVPALSFVIGILLGAIAYPFTDLDGAAFASRRLCGSGSDGSFRNRNKARGDYEIK